MEKIINLYKSIFLNLIKVVVKSLVVFTGHRTIILSELKCLFAEHSDNVIHD